MPWDKILEVRWRGGRRKEVFLLHVEKKQKTPPTFLKTPGKPGEALKYSLQNEKETIQAQDDTKHKGIVFTASSQNKFERVCNKEIYSRLSNNWGLWWYHQQPQSKPERSQGKSRFPEALQAPRAAPLPQPPQA